MLGRSLAAVLLLSISVPALADDDGPTRGPFSIHGGRLLGNGESAVSAGLGWPGLFGQYDTGLSTSFGLGLRGDLLYGSPTSSPGSLVGTHLGCLASAPMRIELSESRRVGLAIGARPGVYLGEFSGHRGHQFEHDEFSVGFLLEPAFLVTITAARSLNVVAGASLPIFVLYMPDRDVTELFFPIVPFGGVELSLADDLNIAFLLRFGPAVHVYEPDSSLEAMLQAMLGIEYRL